MPAATLHPPVDPTRDHTVGPDDAPVTLLEYGDYECPFCGRAHPVVQRLKREYGDRLRLVWRHFPRPEHPHAHHAAEAAEAAGAQGRYWQMHDVLLTHQDALEEADLMRYAAEIGLDVEQFRRDLAGSAAHQRVGEDLASAVHNGAHGTPTFFVNGVLQPGRGDYDQLQAVILHALSSVPRPASRPTDVVTEASAESFPASDPPAWAGHPHPTSDERASA